MKNGSFFDIFSKIYFLISGVGRTLLIYNKIADQEAVIHSLGCENILQDNVNYLTVKIVQLKCLLRFNGFYTKHYTKVLQSKVTGRQNCSRFIILK